MGALAAAAVVVNIPCGMWRAHLKKFTAKWIVSIHASIPAVIVSRRVLGVPKWAIAVSITAAIAGQQVRGCGCWAASCNGRLPNSPHARTP